MITRNSKTSFNYMNAFKNEDRKNNSKVSAWENSVINTNTAY